MKATVVDLRYKMNDILKALDRNERVTVLYHGKTKAVMVPVGAAGAGKIVEHPFFGMTAGDDKPTVAEVMDDLRGSRYDAI